MYPDVHSLGGGGASHLWRDVGSHEGYPNATKADLLLLEPPPQSRSLIIRDRP
jgi:hypothetical protein